MADDVLLIDSLRDTQAANIARKPAVDYPRSALASRQEIGVGPPATSRSLDRLSSANPRLHHPQS